MTTQPFPRPPTYVRFVGYSRTTKSVSKFSLLSADDAQSWKRFILDPLSNLNALGYAVYPDGRRERWS